MMKLDSLFVHLPNTLRDLLRLRLGGEAVGQLSKSSLKPFDLLSDREILLLSLFVPLIQTINM